MPPTHCDLKCSLLQCQACFALFSTLLQYYTSVKPSTMKAWGPSGLRLRALKQAMAPVNCHAVISILSLI